MLEHGGRVRAAAARWHIPVEEWLDLSTGIAPTGYPIGLLSADCWRRLPEDEDGLEATAASCYGTKRLLVLPGSQAGIQTLPRLRPAGVAAVLTPGYGEYAAAWRTAGHSLRPFAATELATVAATADVVILGNPNNPTAERFAKTQLLAAAHALQIRGGWLIVDEAFADVEPEQSLAAVAGSSEAPNLIVLRSLGKFFGLAGARVGFAIAGPDLLTRLAEAVGPWAVSHPAREVARAALADNSWQAMQRERLLHASTRLAQLLHESGLGEAPGTALFRYVVTPDAAEIFSVLAGSGVLVRLFDQPVALRFGVPGKEMEWSRLATALHLPEIRRLLRR